MTYDLCHCCNRRASRVLKIVALFPMPSTTTFRLCAQHAKREAVTWSGFGTRITVTPIERVA